MLEGSGAGHAPEQEPAVGRFLCGTRPAAIAPDVSEGGGMFSASASVRPRLEPRASASITLVAILAVATPALLWARGAANVPQVPSDRADTRAAHKPVKIVGATLRSENCADQVWPYIEPRCLTRGPAAQAPAASQARETASDPRVTTGASVPAGRPAAAAPPAAASPTAAAQVVRRRVATAMLPLPSRRAGRAETDGLAVPPGAVAPGAIPPARSPDRSASSTVDDAWSHGGAERWMGEPRRRAGRRWHRRRHHGRSTIILPY